MLRFILLILCFAMLACDGDETIPAEVYIISTFVPIQKEYEATTDVWATSVLSCAQWTSLPTHDTRVVADFTSTENSYKLEMRSAGTSSILWDIRIRILDHVTELTDNEQRALVVNKMCYYLKDEPDYETEGKWERTVLE